MIVYDDRADDDTVESLRTAYPTPALHEHSRRVFLVETDDLSASVKEHARIGEDAATGALFRVTKTHAGYTDKTLWEWLSKTQLLKDDK